MGRVVRKQQCPSCIDTGQDNLAVYDDGSSYCFGCGYMENTDKKSIHTNIKPVEVEQETMVKDGSFVDLINRGIKKETCKEWGYHLSSYSGYLNGKQVTDLKVAVANYYDKNGLLISQKIRATEKRFKYLGKTTGLPLYGSWRCKPNPNRFIVVVEGIEKALAVSQVFDGKAEVVSLNNGAGVSDKEFKDNYEFLNKYKNIVVLMDMDEAGQAAAERAVALFASGKVRIAKISEKDPDTMLVKGKGNELKQAIWDAETIRPEGVIDLAELDDTVFEDKFEPGFKTGYPLLDKYTGGIRKGELTMVTAGTGIGKTTWCTQMVYDWITDQNIKVADIKLENNARSVLYDYCAMHYGVNPREFRQNPDLLSAEHKRNFLRDFSGNLFLYKHFGSMDAGPLIDLLEYYAVVKEVDFIFFDHISIAVSGLSSSREGERKDIDKLTTKLRELIDRTGVGIICVSHLRNPPSEAKQWEEGRRVRRCDLRGSGSLAQLSDNIISIEGHIAGDDATKDERIIHLLKTRAGDEQEIYCDKFSYDNKTRTINLVKDII